MNYDFRGMRIGYVLTGSFCTLKKSLEQIKRLKEMNAEIIPVLSENTASFDTRFYKAKQLAEDVTSICGRKPFTTIVETEPFGPKDYADVLVVAPCTSNTLGKIVHGINDTSATMAVKSHLRKNKPVVLAIATNDALSQSAANIGSVLKMKKIYLVPMVQDDPLNKPNSMVADFEKIPDTIALAVSGINMRPLII